MIPHFEHVVCTVQLEDAERHRIEAVKENERRLATEELDKWKEQQKAMAEKVCPH